MSARPRSPARLRRLGALLGLSLALGLAACAGPPVHERRVPVVPSVAAPGQTATAEDFMVAAAHPLAARAGQRVLADGGSAVDAAIAVQALLTLVEPQSSGLGGGAFLMHYDADSGRVTAYDGRETAPAAAAPDLFLTSDGAPMDFWDAVIGGRAVGVPGVLRMLALAHADHGRRAWAALFQPAIQRARDGFAVTPRLHRLIAGDDALRRDPAARAHFFTEEGRPLPVGHRLRNPALADTLHRVAEDGADAFYEGPIARDIVAKVRGHPTNAGRLTTADLAAYRAKRRAPLCRPYRGRRVCGMPPPTSGGATTLQILGILSAFDLGARSPLSAEAVHLLAEASRLAFADRNRYLADSDFVAVPLGRLLDRDYLHRRARRIDLSRSLGKARPGLPDDRHAVLPDQPGGRSTSHVAIVDAEGNAVSMTSSIEQAFGAHLMVRGFLLNNQLTDFAFRPRIENRPVANRVQPGKRPRSSMSPTLVLGPEGNFRLAIGSPGGSRIIGYVAQRLVATLDWGLDVQRAIDLPNLVNRNGPTELEEHPALRALAPALRARGHRLRFGRMTSGLHGIARQPDGLLVGGADPRREGVVLGPPSGGG